MSQTGNPVHTTLIGFSRDTLIILNPSAVPNNTSDPSKSDRHDVMVEFDCRAYVEPKSTLARPVRVSSVVEVWIEEAYLRDRFALGCLSKGDDLTGPS